MNILYKTLSICPFCTLLDGNGINQVPGVVFCENNKVWLTASCSIHGDHKTEYCKDEKFFKNIMQFKAPTDSFELDIEDLPRILRGEGRGANRPLSFSITLFKQIKSDLDSNNTGEFISDNEINEQLAIFKKQMQNRDDLSFILKLEGKSCSDIEKLNERVDYISNIYKGPTVLECTYDRLILVARLSNSVFQSPHIYPAVKYYFKSGQEKHCLEEMERFQRNIILEFEGLAAMCTIIIERTDFAWPSISSVLSFVRESPRFWRFVIFSAERGPSSLLSVIKELRADRPIINSVDPIDVLQLFSDNSEIKITDFVPASSILIMEPLLYLLHYGLFSLKISPFCGFINVLFTDEYHKSVPLNRLLDIPKLYQKLIPLLPRLRANKYDISLPIANSLRKIFKSCTRPGIKNFDIISKVIGRNTAESTLNLVQNMQFIIVHNTMDIASVDIMRRCSCATTEVYNNSVVSSCTGCV